MLSHVLGWVWKAVLWGKLSFRGFSWRPFCACGNKDTGVFVHWELLFPDHWVSLSPVQQALCTSKDTARQRLPKGQSQCPVYSKCSIKLPWALSA
jgi:hypothetical protein